MQPKPQLKKARLLKVGDHVMGRVVLKCEGTTPDGYLLFMLKHRTTGVVEKKVAFAPETDIVID